MGTGTSLDWNDYRYFLEVARAGTLSGAARRLGVDQSTVGRRLLALEGQVAVRLFDRTPDGYALTAAGESVRVEVERLEDGFLAVERRLAGGDARIEGVVRLATTEVVACEFLVHHLGALRSRHPGLSIELVTGNEAVDLARRQADVAVRIGGPPKQPNLVVRRIGIGSFALYAAPSYLAHRGRPRVGAGLRGHDIVAYGGELSTVPLSRWITENAQQARVVLRANSVTTVRNAVAAGMGLGLLPCFVAGRDLERISPSVLGGAPIWTVVHEDLIRNARIRAVLRFLSDLMDQERNALSGAKPPREPAG